MNVFVTECSMCGRIKQYDRWKFLHELKLSTHSMRYLERVEHRLIAECPECIKERKELELLRAASGVCLQGWGNEFGGTSLKNHRLI